MYCFYSKLLLYLEKFIKNIDIINFIRPNFNNRDIFYAKSLKLLFHFNFEKMLKYN